MTGETWWQGRRKRTSDQSITPIKAGKGCTGGGSASVEPSSQATFGKMIRQEVRRQLEQCLLRLESIVELLFRDGARGIPELDRIRIVRYDAFKNLTRALILWPPDHTPSGIFLFRF